MLSNRHTDHASTIVKVQSSKLGNPRCACAPRVNKNKHSQNVMATIFSSGCYAPYTYTIIPTLNFLRLPLSSIFCYIVTLGPSTLSSIALSLFAVARDVDYPVLIPSHTMARVHMDNIVRVYIIHGVNAWRVRSRL